MKISPYRQALKEKRDAKACQLYKQGLTTREIGKILGVSFTTVWKATRKLSTVSPINKNKQKE